MSLVSFKGHNGTHFQAKSAGKEMGGGLQLINV